MTTKRDEWGVAWEIRAANCWNDITGILNPEYGRFMSLRQHMLDWAAAANTFKDDANGRIPADETLRDEILITNDAELVAFTLNFIRSETATNTAGTGATDADNVGFFKTYGSVIDTSLSTVISDEISQVKLDLTD